MRTNVPDFAPQNGERGGELLGVRKSTAARLLDCSRWTIDRLIRSGDLEVFQLRGEPRVRYDSLRALIEARTLGRPA